MFQTLITGMNKAIRKLSDQQRSILMVSMYLMKFVRLEANLLEGERREAEGTGNDLLFLLNIKVK